MIERGQIWLADLGCNVGSVQSNKRPVLIIQNNVGNLYAPTVNVIPLTSKRKKSLPTHYDLQAKGLSRTSTVLTEAITTISKEQLITYKGIIENKDLKEIERKLVNQLGICYGNDKNSWDNI